MNLNVIEKLDKAKRYFREDYYRRIINRAEELLKIGAEEECIAELAKLPSEEQLLEMLIEKLKTKSVYKTLKKIAKGKIESEVEEMKGWFSLGTHIAIEVEKGHKEYALLLKRVYEKLGALVYRI